VVLYRTIYPNGTNDVTPIFLIGRYERWKPLLGAINPKRYTAAEKEDLVTLGRWVQERMPAHNATTQPATTQSATTRPAATTAP
jgi:hypothetical protein